jgi:hypothetical protein
MQSTSTQSNGGSRLVLILSSERSGSTLLRVMLGEHSRIVAPSEFFLMRYPDYQTWRSQKPEAIESLVEYFRLLGSVRTAAEIDARCLGLSTVEVYRWLLSALPPGMFLVDKTPAYANSVDTLRRSLALDPYYIWLIRHPLAIIESHVRIKTKKSGAHRLQVLRERIRQYAEALIGSRSTETNLLARLREMKWLLQQTNINAFLSSVPHTRKTVVHFEDLVRAPEATLQVLCSGLGIAIEPSMLQVRLKDRKMNPNLGDPNFHTHTRVDQRKAFAWRERFSESQLGIETVNLMRAIGVGQEVAERQP